MIPVVVSSRVGLYREGLVQILGPITRVDVVATAAVPDELLAKVALYEPEVVLYDAAPPATPEEVHDLLLTAPEAKVIAVAVDGEDDFIAFAEAGVAGFVPREGVTGDLLAVIESVSRGETLFSPQIGAALLRRIAVLATQQTSRRGEDAARLTRRETEILRLIDQGFSNKEIGVRLCIELPTVKNHVHNILEKLNVKRRSEATAYLRHRRAEPDAESGDGTTRKIPISSAAQV